MSGTSDPSEQNRQLTKETYLRKRNPDEKKKDHSDNSSNSDSAQEDDQLSNMDSSHNQNLQRMTKFMLDLFQGKPTNIEHLKPFSKDEL